MSEVWRRLFSRAPLVLTIVVVFGVCVLLFAVGDVLLMYLRYCLSRGLNVSLGGLDAVVRFGSGFGVAVLLGGLIVALVLVLLSCLREEEEE